MSMTSDGDTASILHSASFANALTTNVFPVPGGPNSRHPVIPCSLRIPYWNAYG